MDKLKESAQRVQDKLVELGYTNQVMELPDSTRTAQEAADAIGCDVAQIAKSIIFRLEKSDSPILVVASGVHRVNDKRLSTEYGERFGKADADFVHEHAGYVIGGVPPIAHVKAMTTIIDEDILQFTRIWAAAGHPRAVVELTPDQLVEMTCGRVMRIT